MNVSSVLGTAMTVDRLTARFPEAIEVLNRFGIDMCCGGGVTLAEAADRDGASIDEVQQALVEVLERVAAERNA